MELVDLSVRPTDPQSLFRLPKEHLEDLCVKLQDENSILRQHARTQEQKLRRSRSSSMWRSSCLRRFKERRVLNVVSLCQNVHQAHASPSARVQ